MYRFLKDLIGGSLVDAALWGAIFGMLVVGLVWVILG